MATDELRELRLQYKAAFTTYMRGVHALSEASQSGLLPAAEVLRSEREAFDALTTSRQALLDTLHAHTQGKKAG